MSSCLYCGLYKSSIGSSVHDHIWQSFRALQNGSTKNKSFKSGACIFELFIDATCLLPKFRLAVDFQEWGQDRQGHPLPGNGERTHHVKMIQNHHVKVSKRPKFFAAKLLLLRVACQTLSQANGLRLSAKTKCCKNCGIWWHQLQQRIDCLTSHHTVQHAIHQPNKRPQTPTSHNTTTINHQSSTILSSKVQPNLWRCIARNAIGFQQSFTNGRRHGHG